MQQPMSRVGGSKNRLSPIRLGRVVTVSVLTESIRTPDTSVCFESVELGINRLHSVNSAEFSEMTRRLGRRQKNRIPVFY